MKYIIIITLWMLCFSLSYCQTVECSSSAEVAVISDNLVQIVKLDQSIVQPYKPEITFPSVCNIDRTSCSSQLYEVESVNKGGKLLEKHLWVPNNGPMHYFTVNVNESAESAVTYGPNLHGSDCFKFFHIDSRHLGALCIGRLYDEDLIIPYIIEYNEQGEPHSNRLGSEIEIHLDIENHSPFIVLNNTGKLKAVGISYFEHRSAYKLIIIHYTAEGFDTIDIPPDCPGAHDLQPMNQSDAIIRCANGKVLHFNGYHSTFTTLSYSNIEIISTCPNTMSFLLVQGTDNIIFNKSGVNYHLSVNTSVQPLRIASAACYATGEDDITYYYVDSTSGGIYKLYLGGTITLGSKKGMVPQTVRGGISSDGAMIRLYIDGPILWDKLSSSNHSDVTVHLTDVLTERQSPRVIINGPSVLVQVYTAEKCERVTTKPPDQPEKLEQNSNNQVMGGVQYLLVSLAAVVAVILIVFLFGFIVYRYRKKSQLRTLEHGRNVQPTDNEHDDNRQTDDISPTPSCNSETRLIQEQYVADNQQPPNHRPPIQSQNQENAELVSQNVDLASVKSSRPKNPTTTLAIWQDSSLHQTKKL